MTFPLSLEKVTIKFKK